MHLIKLHEAARDAAAGMGKEGTAKIDAQTAAVKGTRAEQEKLLESMKKQRDAARDAVEANDHWYVSMTLGSKGLADMKNNEEAATAAVKSLNSALDESDVKLKVTLPAEKLAAQRKAAEALGKAQIDDAFKLAGAQAKLDEQTRIQHLEGLKLSIRQEAKEKEAAENERYAAAEKQRAALYALAKQ